MNIVHICNDEKFINAANQTFEKIYPQQNLFLIIHPNDKDLSHVKLETNTKTTTSEDIGDYYNQINKAQIIFFHSYTPQTELVFDLTSKKSILIWFSFGMEIYNDPKLYSRKKLLDKITFSLYKYKKRTLKKVIKDKLRPSLRYTFYKF